MNFIICDGLWQGFAVSVIICGLVFCTLSKRVKCVAKVKRVLRKPKINLVTNWMFSYF